MKKKLYYTISVDDEIKRVHVYEIDFNEPVLFFSLELEVEQISEAEIEKYLQVNGHGNKEEFELIIL